MVRHVGLRSPPPEDAQRPTGRDDAAQRTEVRPSMLGPTRCPVARGPF